MEKEVVKGYIDHFIYKNAENGYGVVSLVVDGEELVCTGIFKDADVGDTLEIEGDIVNHPVYGEQLKVANFKIIMPDDAVSMQRYLGSGAIKGVGEALAARIVKKFGAETFRIIEDEPERLAEIKGISEKKAIDIAMQMAEKREMRDAMMFLSQYGISNTMAVKIFNTYGSRLYGIIQENPYQLADDISGIGFRTADEIAGKIGIRVDSEYRIRSGILFTLLQASLDGNTYLPIDELVPKTLALLETGPEALIDSESVRTQIANLTIDKKLVVKNDTNIFAASFYYEEQGCAVMLSDLNLTEKTEPAEEKIYLDRILEIEKRKGIELDTLQRDAVLKSISNGVVIITGGPGTGKTTTINTIIEYYASQGMDIMLAAPTGRAAKRMTETTGYEARTIHRLLEVSGQMDDEKGSGVHFERNRDNPLEADAIIIDEMSMVDTHLFYSLLKALVPGVHLILVGDSSQLPSVGAGQVLSDLISSQKFPTIYLKKIFRQAEESDIVMNAHRIHNGEKPVIDNKSKDFFFLERNDSNVIYKHMVQLIRDKLPAYVDAGPYDIQVLTPMKKGPLGAQQLNLVLQEYLNPPDPSKKEHTYGDMTLREGDKVMQIRNNYQAEWEVVGKYNVPIDSGMGIFNGDMGIVKEINEYSQDLVVEFDEHRRVRYPFSELDELELSYAITIHKSQGSEYPAVILPLLGGPRMLLNRNLLYTAVTRAKSTVCILGSSQTLMTMVDNEEQLRRYTGLSDRIKEVFDAI
ncbi:exodeoxyribonuclease V alpha subunit [Butyrivibrio hungatei DSM 14810]|uniref:ATP-dependent RecD2 DNA helicase n=1 Tax=Butyrivibrio hungatei DSM 14810 TaxID=1121132 RepID=A0A1M7SWD5_9FIRM|nr:ATP-dependent RecD-like DNA helicase [Butyrivibrio hungatei]SHN62772.1 exodeoxyribonuclease V alpha subunit [Butyrivibrio hungatei DSM 14810]